MDTLTKAERTARMRAVRSRDTGAELLLRRALWRRGLRFRLCDARLPGKPDLVLASRRLVVFVDGDFWHGHQWRRRRLASLDQQFVDAERADYWRAKIRRNIERDFRHTAALVADGWRVLRFWESDVQRRLEECVTMTLAAVKESVDQGQGKAHFAHRASQDEPVTSPRTGVALANRRAVEFFAGIGLVRLALESRGWSVVLANDFDEQKAAMYRQNFNSGDGHLTTADIHQLRAADIPDCALFTASFPCNDLSIAGSMAGLDGANSGAFWGLVRILREMGERRPPLVLLENVVGFLMTHGGRDLEAALVALNELGYACDAFVLDAASFVPQSRTRLFIVARQMTPGESRNLLAGDDCRPPALIDFIASHPDVVWDLRPLPAPPQPTGTLDDIVEKLPDDAPQWWSRERAEYFMNQLSERHTAIAEKMIAGRRISYATAFRRVRKGRSMAELRVDGLAGCLRTPRGGSGRQILFQAGRGKYAVRLLTPRECARLQGVPDSYKIDVRDNQALFGFGDAVCVPVIQWIVDHYLTPVAAELLRGRVLS